MNFRMIRHIIGWLLLFECVFLAVPALTAVVYRERVVVYYLGTMALCGLLGWLCIRRKPPVTALYAREGFVIVAMSWILLSLMGALPLWLSREIPSFVDALFETVSGFTTTGASILPEVERLSHAALIWRSFTHWVGGMGVLVFIMAFVPLSGGRNMHIMKAESPGPSVSKLVPRVRTTAMILYALYMALTVIEFIFLLCGRMSVFDALNTAFSTAGTGGFGVRNDGMAGYSNYLQTVVTVFMLLFSINFSCYYLLLLRRIREAFNAEVRVFLLIVAAAVAVITVDLRLNGVINSVTGESFTLYGTIHHAAFTVSSLISTTGYATADFDLWPALSKTVLVGVMFIGACAGSTGGGIKVSRILILCKSIRREIEGLVHPHRVRRITMDRRVVDTDVIRSTNVYFVAYVLLFAVSVLLISFDDFDLVTNFTAVTSSLNNVGPGLSLVGPTRNFALFSTASKVVLIFDMLAGRLELFPMLALLVPSTWKD